MSKATKEYGILSLIAYPIIYVPLINSSFAQANYEEGVKKICGFQTAEQFWRVYDHIIRPSEHKTTIDYHLFKNGIKPTWEDPMNKDGGKWMVRLKKGLSAHYWETLVLAIIGEQFDVGNEICGAVVSVRGAEDIISVWNKSADNAEATDKIREQLRRILKLPIFVSIEYKKHQDSLTDKSSFRNTQVWRAPPGVRHDREGGAKRETSGEGAGAHFRQQGEKPYYSRQGLGEKEGGGRGQARARSGEGIESGSTGGSFRQHSGGRGSGAGASAGSSHIAYKPPLREGTDSTAGASATSTGAGGGSWSKYHKEDGTQPQVCFYDIYIRTI